MKGAAGGRPAKPAGTARHTGAPTKGTTVLRSDARVAEVPDPTMALTPLAAAWWQRLWASPLATLWDDGDVAVLTRMVMLQTRKTWTPQILAELRQMEDRYLLNPYSRLQQRVVIKAEDEEGAADVSWIEDARQRLGGTG